LRHPGQADFYPAWHLPQPAASSTTTSTASFCPTELRQGPVHGHQTPWRPAAPLPRRAEAAEEQFLNPSHDLPTLWLPADDQRATLKIEATNTFSADDVGHQSRIEPLEPIRVPPLCTCLGPSISGRTFSHLGSRARPEQPPGGPTVTSTWRGAGRSGTV
jgi:hypothetical protein